MDDSADMTATDLAGAAKALKEALGKLETSMDPMLSRFTSLSGQAQEAALLSEDRVKLAAQLDEALEARQAREAEFEALSRQTRQELDATIATLQQALSSQGASHG